MQGPPRLAILFPANSAAAQLPAISQVNEYQFSGNTLIIVSSKYTFSARSYSYYTTTQPQTT